MVEKVYKSELIMKELTKDTFFTVPEKYRDTVLKLLEFSGIPYHTHIGDEVIIEHQSKINYDKIAFNSIDNGELKLARTLRIFQYHHKTEHKYSIKECSEATGVSIYFTENILVKYLDYKKK